LGKVLEKRGLEGIKIHHFDFGENLRRAERGELGLPKEERELISKILSEGRLLKPEEFFLAEKLLFSFLKERDFKLEDLLLLNGLPRNLFQAEKLETLVEMEGIIYLKIDEKILLERLKRDPAGDRKGRVDDLEELVQKKLSWFKIENLPLLDYYSSRKIKLFEIEVGLEDTGETLYEKFLERWKKR